VKECLATVPFVKIFMCNIFWSSSIKKHLKGRMPLTNPLKLTITILLSLSAGFIGSFFTASSVRNWYTTIEKPALNPPSWVFGPVWTILFILMGVAAYLVWKEGLEKKRVKVALGIFLGQLVLNTLWSILFFGLQNPGTALIEIIILWLAIVVTMVAFYRVSKLAAWLLVPYILWVSFASYLNYMIWVLN